MVTKIVNMSYANINIEKLALASEMLKAISHPLRLRIVSFLDQGVKLTVTEIHEKLGIEQSTTSHHLGILKDKGVLSSMREGKNTYYFLKQAALIEILNCLEKCSCSN